MEERDAESSHWAVISAHYQKQFGTTGSNIVTQSGKVKLGVQGSDFKNMSIQFSQ